MNTAHGFDYGQGTANREPGTGIRYGVIGQGSIAMEALADLEHAVDGPYCPGCGHAPTAGEQVPADADERADPHVDPHVDPADDPGTPDYHCPHCRMWLATADVMQDSDAYEPTADGYVLQDCLQSDLMILRSPFVTYAPFCSPCVPGAGDLDNADGEPDHGGLVYCLGHDWFEEGRAPYIVYAARTLAVVEPE